MRLYQIFQSLQLLLQRRDLHARNVVQNVVCYSFWRNVRPSMCVS